MALPSSGTISMNDLRTEFGYSGTVDMYTFYTNRYPCRGGGYSLSDWYGYIHSPCYYTWLISEPLPDPNTYGCYAGGPFPTTVYSNNGSFAESVQFFTDTALTSPFNGGNNWYTESTFTGGYQIQINTTGYNVSIFAC